MVGIFGRENSKQVAIVLFSVWAYSEPITEIWGRGVLVEKWNISSKFSYDH